MPEHEQEIDRSQRHTSDPTQRPTRLPIPPVFDVDALNDRLAVEGAIAEVRAAAWALAAATGIELACEHAKPLEKDAAIRRVMQTESEPGKKHSATSAEKVCEGDATYAAFLTYKIETVKARIVAQGVYDAAKLTAALQVRLVGRDEL